MYARTEWNDLVPAEDLEIHRIKVGHVGKVCVGREATMPNDGVDLRSSLLLDFRIQAHSEDKRELC